MNYNIKIGDTSFEVVIDDINKRPIVAHVNGQEFLVSPETFLLDPTPDHQLSNVNASNLSATTSPQAGPLNAPLPGTVIEVFVKPGDQVKAGQVILIIEAMKMKNSIRCTQDGTISTVLVSAGQTVAHKQALVEFSE